jgi:hypothetical protein
MTQVSSAAREITVGQLAGCQLANPDDVLGTGGTGARRLSRQPGHG